MLLCLSVMFQTVKADAADKKTPPAKKEIVQYATGPGDETNADVLGTREVKVRKPDSDGVAAIKTLGRFIVDFVTLPLQIVKVLWESITE